MPAEAEIRLEAGAHLAIDVDAQPCAIARLVIISEFDVVIPVRGGGEVEEEYPTQPAPGAGKREAVFGFFIEQVFAAETAEGIASSDRER